MADALQKHLIALAVGLTGFEAERVDPAASMVELGFDSLVLTQLAQRIGSEFGVTIPFRDFFSRLRTLDSVAERIRDARPDNASAQPGSSNLATDIESFPANSVRPWRANPPGGMPSISHGSISEEGVAGLLSQQLAVLEQQLVLIASALNSPAPSAKLPSLTSPDTAESTTARSSGTTSLSAGDGDAEEEGLTPHQEAELHNLITDWSTRTARSKAHIDRDRDVHADPRTAAGFHPWWKEIVYPLVVDRSDGPYLWDIDGNRYVDLLNGFGPSFLGHSPPFIVEAIRKQLDAGFEIGPQTPDAGEAARLICEMTGVDRAVFTCTGSEAVMTAIRAARTYTGRDGIALFASSYHGNFDEVLVRGSQGPNAPRAVPGAAGIPRRSVENIFVLDYGSDRALEQIRSLGSRLAAVLVEPVQSRHPELQPRAFLKKLREITRETGALLIFDEVVSGFRCHPGGAQAVFEVEADLVTFGKVLGGGMPIGVLAGRRPYIDTLDGGPWHFGDDSGPTSGVTFSAGTFVRHPLAIAAAVATLRYLKASGPELQAGVNARTTRLVERLTEIAATAEAPIDVVHFSSQLFFRPRDSSNEFNTLFFHLMRRHGVYVLEGFPSYLTVSHKEEHLRAVEVAFEAAIAEMRRMGFWGSGEKVEGRMPASDSEEDFVDSPPVPGARLGRDADGSAAWFVDDPTRPGAFIRVG